MDQSNLISLKCHILPHCTKSVYCVCLWTLCTDVRGDIIQPISPFSSVISVCLLKHRCKRCLPSSEHRCWFGFWFERTDGWSERLWHWCCLVGTSKHRCSVELDPPVLQGRLLDLSSQNKHNYYFFNLKCESVCNFSISFIQSKYRRHYDAEQTGAGGLFLTLEKVCLSSSGPVFSSNPQQENKLTYFLKLELDFFSEGRWQAQVLQKWVQKNEHNHLLNLLSSFKLVHLLTPC